MSKKILAVLLAMVLVLATFAACGKTGGSESDGGKKNDGDGKDNVTIRVGTMANQTGTPIQYAIDHGYYEEAGVNVEMILFPTGAPINEAMAAKQLDLASSGMASIFALGSGDCYWLADIVDSKDGFGIFVRGDSPILNEIGNAKNGDNICGSADTVKGCTILGSVGTSDQFLAVSWANQFGLGSNDINMLNMDRGPAVQAFISGEGDAIAAGGPPQSTQLYEAGCKMIANMNDIAGFTIRDGLIGRKEFVDAHEEAVQRFVDATMKAVDAIYADDKDHADFCLKFYNDNGKGMTQAMVDEEVATKEYMGKEVISREGYKFGATMIGMIDFYIGDGKLTEDQMATIIESMNPKFLEKTYGVDVEVFEKQ